MEINTGEPIKCVRRLLCRKYLVAHFDTLSIHVQLGGRVREYTFQWAFGVLADGQWEVLGAWLKRRLGGEFWRVVFDDLKTRGAEGIRFVSSREQAGLRSATSTAFPDATVLPPEVPRRNLTPLNSDSPPRRNRIIQWSDSAAQELHDCLRRTVVRQGCFADLDAAASSVVGTLERAESRLRALRPSRDTARHRGQGALARSTRKIGTSKNSPLSA